MSELILTNIPILILSCNNGKADSPRCSIHAPLPIDISPVQDGFSYWLSDIILMPQRKFTNRMNDKSKMMYHGWQYQDILRESDWPNPENWTEQALKGGVE